MKEMKVCNCYNNLNRKIDFEIFEKVRKDFTILENDKIYLDSSATCQKPIQVLNKISEFYSKYCANSDRGNYEWAKMVEKEIEESRRIIANFIKCNQDEIVFTSGATESSNLIAYSYAMQNLKNDDEILLCKQDHKSTTLPYFNIQSKLQNFGINICIREILIDTEGDYKEDDLISKVNNRTKIIVLTHIHNVYGLEMDIKKIIPRIRKKNKDCKIILDCSQSIGHMDVNLKELDIDFAYFSGHKIFSSMGIGVCYIKKENFKNLKPFIIGGGFEFNSFENLEVANYKSLENGTKNIEGIFTLRSAIDYINNIGINNIENYIWFLTRYLYDNLKTIHKIEFSKGIDKCSCNLGYGIVTFKISNISSSEIGEVLSDYGIYVRTGDFCISKSSEDFIRVSLQIYNNKEEIDKLIKVLKYITTEE